MALKNKRLVVIILSAAGLLLIPALAMLFTSEVNWTASDFLIAGALLLGTGLVVEFVLRKVKKPTHRLAICGVVVALLLLTWLELAVGLFGTPLAGS